MGHIAWFSLKILPLSLEMWTIPRVLGAFGTFFASGHLHIGKDVTCHPSRKNLTIKKAIDKRQKSLWQNTLGLSLCKSAEMLFFVVASQ